MSTLETSQRDWPNISDKKLDSKYEKCRNITEEIYKRINITFQIKKLEAGQSELSENSEQIDSNELSNETDLFACDKSDLTSSTEAEKPPTDCVKFININNNEEKNKPAAASKRPKKRFRKRVKKRPVRARSDSEGSSDEAPLSRIADAPNLLILSADIGTATAVLKPKPEKKSSKKDCNKKPSVAKSPQKKQVPETTDKKNTELPTKSLSVRIDKLPIQDVMLSMKDDNVSMKNYRSFMKDNKLTIKMDNTKHEKSTAKDNSSAKNNNPSIEEDKMSMKTDKLSMKTDKLSLTTDNLSMKEKESAQRKNCSLCSLTFRGERGLRRHMSMSHLITAEEWK